MLQLTGPDITDASLKCVSNRKCKSPPSTWSSITRSYASLEREKQNKNKANQKQTADSMQ